MRRAGSRVVLDAVEGKRLGDPRRGGRRAGGGRRRRRRRGGAERLLLLLLRQQRRQRRRDRRRGNSRSSATASVLQVLLLLQHHLLLLLLQLLLLAVGSAHEGQGGHGVWQQRCQLRVQARQNALLLRLRGRLNCRPQQGRAGREEGQQSAPSFSSERQPSSHTARSHPIFQPHCHPPAT